MAYTIDELPRSYQLLYDEVCLLCNPNTAESEKIIDLLGKLSQSLENGEIPPDSLLNDIKYLSLQGGGMKGNGYIAPILIFERLGLLDQIREVCGSSVGGIVSALIALGFTGNEIAEEMKNLDFKLLQDQTQIGWVQRLRNDFKLLPVVKQMSELKKAIKPMMSQIPVIGHVSKATGRVINKAADLAQGIEMAVRVAGTSKMGVWEGDALLNLVKSLVAKKLGDPNATLADLAKRAEKDPRFKKLIVTASNVEAAQNESGLEYLSAETYPEMTIAEAVRITGSFPFGFCPVRYLVKDKQGKTITEKLFVDGGMLENLPLYFAKRGHQNQSLALALDSTDASVNPKSKKKINKGVDLLMGAINTVLSEGQSKASFGERLIDINVQGMGTLEMDASNEKISRLLTSGAITTLDTLSTILTRENRIMRKLLKDGNNKALNEYYLKRFHDAKDNVQKEEVKRDLVRQYVLLQKTSKKKILAKNQLKIAALTEALIQIFSRDFSNNTHFKALSNAVITGQKFSGLSAIMRNKNLSNEHLSFLIIQLESHRNAISIELNNLLNEDRQSRIIARELNNRNNVELLEVLASWMTTSEGLSLKPLQLLPAKLQIKINNLCSDNQAVAYLIGLFNENIKSNKIQALPTTEKGIREFLKNKIERGTKLIKDATIEVDEIDKDIIKIKKEKEMLSHKEMFGSQIQILNQMTALAQKRVNKTVGFLSKLREYLRQGFNYIIDKLKSGNNTIPNYHLKNLRVKEKKMPMTEVLLLLKDAMNIITKPGGKVDPSELKYLNNLIAELLKKNKHLQKFSVKDKNLSDMVHNISFQLNNVESNHSKLLRLQVELGNMRRKLTESEDISPSQKHHIEIRTHKLELEIKKYSTLLKTQTENLNSKFKEVIPNLESDRSLIFSGKNRKTKTTKHLNKASDAHLNHKKNKKPLS